IWQRKASAGQPRRDGKRKSVAGLATIYIQRYDCTAVLEFGADASRETGSQSGPVGIGKNQQSLAAGRTAVGPEPIPCGRKIFSRTQTTRSVRLAVDRFDHL